MSHTPNSLIFASGSPDGGGSGARRGVEAAIRGDINTRVSAIITNHLKGGLAKLAAEKKIRLLITPNKPLSREDWSQVTRYMDENGTESIGVLPVFPKRPADGEYSQTDLDNIGAIYEQIIQQNDWEYIFLSGWVKFVAGLPVHKTVNIHPGPTQEPYGGLHMHGDHVHQKIWEDFEAGQIKKSCVTMHFVTPEIDGGPIIAQIPVELEGCQNWEEVKKRVNACEAEWQWKIAKLVIDGRIKLDETSGQIVISDFHEADKILFPAGTGFGQAIDLTK